MKIYQIDPTLDARWAELVQKHPRASVFHTVAWLEALKRTFGYQPVAFTTSSPMEELKNGLVFCRVESWLTGHRLVSLPFSDHCEPLSNSAEDVNFMIRYLQASLDRREWKYLEIRPNQWNFREAGDGIGLLPAAAYFLHILDLRPDLKDVFRGLDKDSVQRRVRRAERAGLVERRGRSEDLLRDFFCLFVKTRSRHGVPPTPYDWFRNLIACQGPGAEIRVAYMDATPAAAILTLHFRDVVYYKYGCSDRRLNKLGATPWLLWKAIEAGKLNGAAQFDMGRTQEDNPGLLAFKGHWVPQSQRLVYWKFPYETSLSSPTRRKSNLAMRIFSYMPNSVLTIAGKLIYRHIG